MVFASQERLSAWDWDCSHPRARDATEIRRGLNLNLACWPGCQSLAHQGAACDHAHGLASAGSWTQRRSPVPGSDNLSFSLEVLSALLPVANGGVRMSVLQRTSKGRGSHCIRRLNATREQRLYHVALCGSQVSSRRAYARHYRPGTQPAGGAQALRAAVWRGFQAYSPLVMGGSCRLGWLACALNHAPKPTSSDGCANGRHRAAPGGGIYALRLPVAALTLAKPALQVGASTSLSCACRFTCAPRPSLRTRLPPRRAS